MHSSLTDRPGTLNTELGYVPRSASFLVSHPPQELAYLTHGLDHEHVVLVFVKFRRIPRSPESHFVNVEEEHCEQFFKASYLYSACAKQHI